MIELLKGKPVSDSIRESVIRQVEEGNGSAPKLVILRVGDNPEDMSYEKSATKKLSGMGINVVSCVLSQDVSADDFKSEFVKINEDESVDGILIMRPLPKHLKEAEQWMTLSFDPEKDVDGICPVNLAGIMRGDSEAFAPCTAQSVIEIIKGYGIELSGKNVTLIGRSMVVGKPLSMLLLKENATVTICHTKTRNLAEVCRNADIVIAAAGHAGLVGASFVRDGQVLVDVGVNVDSEGNLVGDINIMEIESAGVDVKITPVPGGVGVVTTAVLAEHVCMAWTKKNK